jgi:hypothetical protein
MLTKPHDVPSAPDISCTSASCASSIDSSNTSVSHYATTSCSELRGTIAMSPVLVADGATTSCSELRGTIAMSHVLVADGATRGKYGDVTEHSSGRWTIRADEV